MKSTKNQLATELESQLPKTAVNNVFQSQGGVLEATSAGKLPRS